MPTVHVSASSTLDLIRVGIRPELVLRGHFYRFNQIKHLKSRYRTCHHPWQVLIHNKTISATPMKRTPPPCQHQSIGFAREHVPVYLKGDMVARIVGQVPHIDGGETWTKIAYNRFVYAVYGFRIKQGLNLIFCWYMFHKRMLMGLARSPGDNPYWSQTRGNLHIIQRVEFILLIFIHGHIGAWY